MRERFGEKTENFFQSIRRFFIGKLKRSNSRLNVHRVDDADDDGDDAGALILQHLTGAAALIEDEDGIAHTRVGVVEGDEVATFSTTFNIKRLDDKLAPMPVSRVADGGHNCSNNFSDDHDVM